MAVNAPIQFCVPSKDQSCGRFAMNLIEAFGSLEFAIGVSRDDVSETLIHELRLMTNGLLVVNAVLFEAGKIRVPGFSEAELLEKKWKIPVRWLSIEVEGEKSRSAKGGNGQVYPHHLLQTVLYQNGISVFMAADHRLVSGVEGFSSTWNQKEGFFPMTPVHSKGDSGPRFTRIGSEHR
ncbi:MAG: hypothetical protein ACYCYP_07875 [Leptospirales bacterium]